MAKLSKDLAAGTLHPREAIYASGSFGGLGSELIVAADGAASVALDLRGTFTMSIEVSGSVDGVNWTLIPVRPVGQTTIVYQLASFSPFTGVLVGKCSPYRLVRARVTSYTSGTATAVLLADTAPLDDSPPGAMTSQFATATGAAGAAVTLTLAAPGNGLRHYITGLTLNRFAAATLTASATPVIVTTTNIPGSLAFTVEAEAAQLGTISRWREEFGVPLAASSQGTATTIVCPAITGVIWRATAGFFIGP